MNILELAQSLLTGTVAKADPPMEDPDKPTAEKPTPGVTSEEEVEAARKEAQAGAQAQAAQAGPEGEAGGAPGGSEGAPGGAAPTEGEPPQPEEEPVEKAEIIKSMQFLAEQYGITGAEVAKAFSGTEADPVRGPDVLGKGVEYLEGLLKKQGDILERIAGFLQELTSHTVKQGEEIGKSLEAAEAARALATETAAKVDALPKTAPAKPAKAVTGEEIAKAEGAKPRLNGQDLFLMALRPDCPLSPTEMARTNRAAQGTFGS